MSGEGGVHKNHRERMRARFDAEGLAGFHDHEALELLLYYVYPQGDVNPVAHRLMKRFGSFHQVLEASPEQLMEVPGVGQSAARMLTMVFQIGLRCCQDGVRYREGRHELDSTEKMAKYIAPQMAGLSAEASAVVCVDSRLRPIDYEFVSKGTVRATEVMVRRIAEIAVRSSATAVILAHSHPRGRAAASPEDFETTRQLQTALRRIGIELLDHIVLGDGEYISLRDYGALEPDGSR